MELEYAAPEAPDERPSIYRAIANIVIAIPLVIFGPLMLYGGVLLLLESAFGTDRGKDWTSGTWLSVAGHASQK